MELNINELQVQQSASTRRETLLINQIDGLTKSSEQSKLRADLAKKQVLELKEQIEILQYQGQKLQFENDSYKGFINDAHENLYVDDKAICTKSRELKQANYNMRKDNLML